MGSHLYKKTGSTKTKLSPYHHPHCYDCFSALRLNPVNNKWYCDTCQEYRELHNKTQIHIKKMDRNIIYIIGAGTILLCVYVIQTSIDMTFFEKITAIIGVFIGTTLAFLCLKLLFSTQKTTS